MTEPFRVRSLTMAVYLPNFMFAVGQGAAIPVIALLALDLGANPALAGVIVALRGFGTMLFDAPAGILVARIGEKRSMLVASVVLAGVAGSVAGRPSLPVYAALVVLLGGCWSIWTLARLAYATEASPPAHRGRVMSTMGGVTRMGQAVGPFLGSLALIPFGLAGPFAIQALLGVAATITMTFSKTQDPPSNRETGRHTGLIEVFNDHRRTFATAGVAVVCIQALRASRQAIIPLWGDQLAMTAGEISIIFGISSAMEVALFYPMGLLMDRKGRKWASVPSIALLSVGVAAIPLTSSATGLMLVGILIGVANGMGAGLNMTLASDLSPAGARSEFLGLWRFITDGGTVGGPMLVAAVTSIATLGTAAVTIGAIGVVGTAILSLAVPETRATDP